MMTREELLKKLNECAESDDAEVSHADADEAIIDYIGDDEIKRAFAAIQKYYS